MIRKVYQNIQEKRLEKNFTQEYMADQLSISQTHYSKIERGIKNITLERFIKIGEILEVDPKDFFDPIPFDCLKRKIE